MCACVCVHVREYAPDSYPALYSVLTHILFSDMQLAVKLETEVSP